MKNFKLLLQLTILLLIKSLKTTCNDEEVFECFITQMKSFDNSLQSLVDPYDSRIIGSICQNLDSISNHCQCSTQMKTKFSQERCSGATPKQSFLQYQKCFPNVNVADLLACSPPNETCAGIVSGLQCQQDVYQEKCNASSAFADIMYIDAVNGFNNFSNCTTEVATNFHSKVTTSNFWLYIAIALGVLGFLGVIAASVAYNKAQINPQTKRYS